MNIIVESHIPYIRGIFERVGHTVSYLSPEQITPEAVRDADALVIRTRTKCDASLLSGSRVSIIATATIGTDHIDLPYCAAAGIRVANAPGCNAPAVAQYVLSTIGRLLPGRRPVIGIVGVGHVGSVVLRWAEANGFATRLCDPPLGLNDPLADADVITFHTPLDSTTYHMADARFFASLTRRPLIINAARGPVVDTPALVGAIRSGAVSGAAIDCWEGEPAVNQELLALAAVATPHVAGYSLEGKRRATAMAVRAVDFSLNLPVDPVAEAPSLDEIMRSYDPLADTAHFKAAPLSFEALRNNYDYRPEPRVAISDVTTPMPKLSKATGSRSAQ